jgi:hypothetical protein
MKLFTKEIDSKLFEQYKMGSDLEKQKVVAKIFNPYGRGTWYLLNSDPQDPDYIWAIVDFFEVEMGSVSRSELEGIKVPPFGLGLERDMSFTPINAKELFEGLLNGEHYKDGGIMLDKDFTAIEKEYKENEDNNAHSENVVLLAENFGTEEEKAEAKEILEKHNEEGSLSSQLRNRRSVLEEKLWDKYQALKKIYANGGQTTLFGDGGNVAEQNKEMLKNQAKEFMHHSQELNKLVENVKEVDAWVVAKAERASTDLSDITHYLEGRMEKGGMMAKGGDLLKEDDYVWNAVGNKLVVNKVTDDEYYFDYFGSISPKPFKKEKVNEYIKTGQWTLKAPKMEDSGMMAKGGKTKYDFDVIVKTPKGLVTKKDFDGFTKEEIIKWCEDRGWVYNPKGEKLGGSILKEYEFFIKVPTKYNVILPKNKMAKGGEVKKAVWHQQTIGKTPENDEGYWENYEYATSEELEPKNGRYRGYKWVLMTNIQEPEGYWEKKEMAKGGKMNDEEGIDLFEDYENIPPKVQKILDKYEDDFINGDYQGTTKALKELEKIGYTFEFYLDGVAYDLRPIGTKGKVESMDEFAMGGATFKDKVNAISKRLEGKKVPTRLKKDYGATYDKKEAKQAGQRIAGSMLQKIKMRKK